MLSIQELINEVSHIREQSQMLSLAAGAANQELGQQKMVIADLTRGSKTGQDAVRVLQAASYALSNACTSMAALSRTCDNCVRDLEK